MLSSLSLMLLLEDTRTESPACPAVTELVPCRLCVLVSIWQPFSDNGCSSLLASAGGSCSSDSGHCAMGCVQRNYELGKVEPRL